MSRFPWRKNIEGNQAADRTADLSLAFRTAGIEAVFPEEVVESMRQFILRAERDGKMPKRLALVAALRGEGVTYISRALGTTMANDMRSSVCIVELNWWWPSVRESEEENESGLAGVLTGEIPLEEAVVETNRNNLFYLPAGTLPRRERPVFARSLLLQEQIEHLTDQFDHIILDIPALRATSDAVPLAGLGSTCGVVLRQGVTRIEDARLALDEIEHLPILGVILNRVNYTAPASLMKLIHALG